MTTQTEALKLALAALHGFIPYLPIDRDKKQCDKYDNAITAIKQALAAPEQDAWDEGYRAGVNDERTSQDNIGIAGYGMKIEPARKNPYRTTTLAATESKQ